MQRATTDHPSHRSGRRAGLLAAVLTVALFVAACGGGSAIAATKQGGGSKAKGGTTITIKTFAFSPQALTVKPGQKVTVINKTPVTHTVTSTKHKFNTGDIKGHTTTSFKAPTKPGKYSYICEIHQYMTGTLVVS